MTAKLIRRLRYAALVVPLLAACSARRPSARSATPNAVSSPRPRPASDGLASPGRAPGGSDAARPVDLKSDLAYVPQNAVGALTINVDSLRDTPLSLAKAVKAAFAGFDERHGQDAQHCRTLGLEPQPWPSYGQAVAHLGFDPARDLHAIVLAAGPEFPKKGHDVLAVAEAQVDEAQLVHRLKRLLTVEDDGPGRYYLLGSDLALAFRGNHVLFGAVTMVREALKKVGPSSALRQALAPHLDKQLGFALQLSFEMKNQLWRDQRTLATMLTESGELEVAGGATFQSVSTFATARPAAAVAHDAKEMLDDMKKDPKTEEMGLAAVLQNVKVRAAGSELRIDLSLTKSELDPLEKSIDRFLGGFLARDVPEFDPKRACFPAQ